MKDVNILFSEPVVLIMNVGSHHQGLDLLLSRGVRIDAAYLLTSKDNTPSDEYGQELAKVEALLKNLETIVHWPKTIIILPLAPYEIENNIEIVLKIVQDNPKQKILADLTAGRRIIQYAVLYALSISVHTDIYPFYRADGVVSRDELIWLPMLPIDTTEARLLEVLKLLSQGKTVQEIIKDTRRDESTIYRRLKDLVLKNWITEDYKLTETGKLILLREINV